MRNVTEKPFSSIHTLPQCTGLESIEGLINLWCCFFSTCRSKQTREKVCCPVIEESSMFTGIVEKTVTSIVNFPVTSVKVLQMYQLAQK